jgi:hypothetical protein
MEIEAAEAMVALSTKTFEMQDRKLAIEMDKELNHRRSCQPKLHTPVHKTVDTPVQIVHSPPKPNGWLSPAIPGERIEVYWPGEKRFFAGRVLDVRDGKVIIYYDDGEVWVETIGKFTFRSLGREPPTNEPLVFECMHNEVTIRYTIPVTETLVVYKCVLST